MCSSNPPPPPDYESAARATAAGDLETARTTAAANRPDIYTPEGATTWQQGTGFDEAAYGDALSAWREAGSNPKAMPIRSAYVMGDPDKWIGTQTLNPEAQKSFESSQRIQSGLGGLGEQAIGSVGEMFGTKYETPGETPGYTGPAGELPSFGGYREGVRQAMLGRVNEDIDRDRERASASLIAQGHQKGTPGYEREMDLIDRRLTDARQQAEIAATDQAVRGYGADIAGRGQMGKESMADFTTGMDVQKQQIQNALLERQTPLNEINAFRSGSQVNVPNFQPYGQQVFTGGPDLMGAAQSTYRADLAGHNADVAQQNALTGGLFSLGAGAIGSGLPISQIFS